MGDFASTSRFCVTAFTLALAPLTSGSALGAELKSGPAQPAKDNRASIDDLQVSLCQSIADALKRQGRPEDPVCKNILETHRAGSNKKSMQAYCRGGPAKADICELARATAARLSTSLPIRINAQSSLTGAQAKGKALTLTYTFNVAGSQVRGLATHAFQSTPETAESLSAQARNQVCSIASMTSVVNAGLQIETFYVSRDNKLLGSANVNRCP
ncbi:hypothetical protein JOD31_000695 [Methylopila capsulata]|uniref:Uncharacterized protein n=1 Tax=Methylopila capsulata TaxID=61654 RepID=A0A9W6IVB0_9HYPH|nr:hypothetical protein [Methylopila capsulata]MBM7850483.1 hypothetical protein [Methylopila capsulata]GLK55776.1 hypothetical protein GCM10008170_17950 [Methylopila capsulata]